MAGNFPPLTPRVESRQNPAHDPYPFREGPDQFHTGWVITAESTTSATWTDLTTAGPSVTVQTGTKAVVTVSALVWNTSAGDSAQMSASVSGATTLAASSLRCISVKNPGIISTSYTVIHDLTPGLNTFTAEYQQSGGGTANFQYRRILVQI